MKPGSGETLFEPAREVPVYGSCDVLVLGGGPGGTAAAIGAAAAGADTVLVERYGQPELRRALAQSAARSTGVLGDGAGRRRRGSAGGPPRAMPSRIRILLCNAS